MALSLTATLTLCCVLIALLFSTQYAVSMRYSQMELQSVFSNCQLSSEAAFETSATSTVILSQKVRDETLQRLSDTFYHGFMPLIDAADTSLDMVMEFVYLPYMKALDADPTLNFYKWMKQPAPEWDSWRRANLRYLMRGKILGAVFVGVAGPDGQYSGGGFLNTSGLAARYVNMSDFLWIEWSPNSGELSAMNMTTFAPIFPPIGSSNNTTTNVLQGLVGKYNLSRPSHAAEFSQALLSVGNVVTTVNARYQDEKGSLHVNCDSGLQNLDNYLISHFNFNQTFAFILDQNGLLMATTLGSAIVPGNGTTRAKQASLLNAGDPALFELGSVYLNATVSMLGWEPPPPISGLRVTLVGEDYWIDSMPIALPNVIWTAFLVTSVQSVLGEVEDYHERQHNVARETYVASFAKMMSITYIGLSMFIVSSALGLAAMATVSLFIARPLRALCGTMEDIGRMCQEPAGDFNIENVCSVHKKGALTVFAEVRNAQSALDHMLAKLQDSKLQVEASTRRQHAFFAKATHELRTPLNGIVGMSSLLLRSNPTVHQQTLLTSLEASAADLVLLVNDFLDLYKADARTLTIEPTLISNFATLMEACLTMLKVQTEQKGLLLVVNHHLPPAMKAAGNPGPVVLDALRFRQCVNNLVGNAVKFTSQGKITVEVHYLAHARDTDLILEEIRRKQGYNVRVHHNFFGPEDEDRTALLVTVTDTGSGMDHTAEQLLFKPFSQLQTLSTASGTGLGLSLVHAIVQKTRGATGALSARGMGSCFYFAMAAACNVSGQPVTPLLPEQADLSYASETPAVAALSSVALVDDNRINTEVLSKMLHHLGCGVSLCESSATEFCSKASNSIDVTLGVQAWFVDLWMPDLDGFEVAKRLRALGVKAPIVCCSAESRKDEIDRALSQDFDLFLQKPVTMQALKSLISRVQSFNTFGSSADMKGCSNVYADLSGLLCTTPSTQPSSEMSSSSIHALSVDCGLPSIRVKRSTSIDSSLRLPKNPLSPVSPTHKANHLHVNGNDQRTSEYLRPHHFTSIGAML